MLEPSLAELDLGLDLELDFEPDILCTCRRFCGPVAHPAQWWVKLSCGCPYPMCRRALRIATVRLKGRALTCRLCATEQIAISSVAPI